MISVDEARMLVLNHVVAGKPVRLNLKDALGHVLSDDVCAKLDSPLFTASAMDGYAVRAEDTRVASESCPACFQVDATVYAGDSADGVLVKPGSAVRIMTGAIVPAGATAVVMQEDVDRDDSGITLRKPVREGDNIRQKGEEIFAGDVALSRGTKLSPAALGCLASLGVTEVVTHALPRIAILPTGDELMHSSRDLSAGKIPDSNSIALAAAFRHFGVEAKIHLPAGDTPEALRRAMQDAMENSDWLVLSGGVSVGDKDHVCDVALHLGVQTVFHKVAQKPGKPLFFGSLENKLVFGLPGNPASALVCFVAYLAPALKKAMGWEEATPQSGFAVWQGSLRKKRKHLTEFLRGKISKRDERWIVRVPEGQESHKMISFARANCLVVLPEGVEQMDPGDIVAVHALPWEGAFL